MSQIGWVDFSSEERERVSQVLAMLKEKGTLDELGIGQVRDAFAEQLFPGFSTIQTRAKYLVTVPRIFHDYTQIDTRQRRKTPLIQYLNQQEDRLAEVLVARHQEEKTAGIIGSESVGRGGVARKPSSVYWNAFRQLGIVNSKLSLKEFVRLYESLANHAHHHGGSEEDDDDISTLAHLLQKIPEEKGKQSSWLEQAEIDLTFTEANYLKQKFLTAREIEHSVPCQLFRTSLLEEALKNDNEFVATEAKSGSRLEVLYECVKNKEISIQCKETLRNALEFSQAMEGAHLRYNCVIAHRANNERKLSEYELQFTEWLDQFGNTSLFREDYYQNWMMAAFPLNKSINARTESFIAKWCQLIASGTSTAKLDEFIIQRANDNKGARSLLRKALPESQNWVGMHKLDYRWTSAIRILRDIEQGLKR